MLLLLAYPCSSPGRGWSQDLSPGLGELDILRLHLAVLTLRSSLPLGADEDSRLQRSGWHPKVLNVRSLASLNRLMSHLEEKKPLKKKNKIQ